MFKNRLRSARIARGFTLQYVADFIGIPLRSYQKYEGGQVAPDFDRLVSLADLLNVPTDWLLCRDDYLCSLGVCVDVPPEGPPRRPKSQKSL